MKFYKSSDFTIAILFLGLFVASEAFAQTNLPKKTVKKKGDVVVNTNAGKVEPDSFNPFDRPVIAFTPEIPDEISFCGQTIDLRKTDMRERFDREMMAMMYLHSSTLLLLKRANRYFPVIEPILKANDVPEDLKYLACIESGLNPRAVSSAKAVGMWQFMPETAMQYGLEVNLDVDERYHFEKETVAACNYLKKAYAFYGDWPTVAASYNAGFSRISKELQRQGEKTSFNLWLVEETTRYVFRILACKEFMTHPQKYGYYLKKEQLYMPPVCKDTVITGKVSNWVTFAKEKGLSYYDLKMNNLWIRNDSLENISGKAYNISIPLEETLHFDKNKMTVHQKNWVID